MSFYFNIVFEKSILCSITHTSPNHGFLESLNIKLHKHLPDILEFSCPGQSILI